MSAATALLLVAAAIAAEPVPKDASKAASEKSEKKAPPPAGLASGGWKFEELRRFPVPEAGQGVVVDGDFFYALNNYTVAKYRKATGERVALWDGGKGGPVIHINAGIVHADRLYCAHSNYPGVPMLSSVEIFDTATLQHVGSYSLGRTDGSLTWIDRREGKWIACFVHYGKKGGEPGKGPEWTHLVEYDDNWQRLRGWARPADLVAHAGVKGYSLSGGAFGPGGKLFATGHDDPELYVLDFPTAGSVLKWIATVPIAAEGQSFGWDAKENGMFYSIGRKKREVIVGRVTGP
ncbi:MAG: hypothetical protein V4773_19095 [Verrucomicrobiota bacterium]